MQRVYVIHVRVTVEDDRPDDPENEENIVYAAYAEAKRQLDDNAAEWWAEEEL